MPEFRRTRKPDEFVSLHYLRRTARAAARRLEGLERGNQYRIARYVGGRFRWAVKRRGEVLAPVPDPEPPATPATRSRARRTRQKPS